VLQNVVAVPVSSAAAHEAAYHGVPLTTLEDAKQVLNGLRAAVLLAAFVRGSDVGLISSGGSVHATVVAVHQYSTLAPYLLCQLAHVLSVV
jgi:hypothetical protein